MQYDGHCTIQCHHLLNIKTPWMWFAFSAPWILHKDASILINCKWCYDKQMWILLEPIEVTCWEFAGCSLFKALTRFGITEAVKNNGDKNLHRVWKKLDGLGLRRWFKELSLLVSDQSQLSYLGEWSLILKDLKPLMNPKTSLMMHPCSSLRCVFINLIKEV